MSLFPPSSPLLSATKRSAKGIGVAVLTIVLATSLFFAGCDSRFVDVNSNPNEPEEVTPNLLLPNVIRSSVNTSVNTAHTTGNLVLQYVSKVSFNTGIDRYDWAGVGYWDALYSDLRNVEEIVRIGQERDNASYEGVGLVLRSWIFSMLTNAYGDVPYLEAIKAEEGENTPAYDSQEAIYRGMLNDLERANELLNPASGASIDGDILYGGDLMKWKKLANSIRLRLLMRLSEKQGDIEGIEVVDDFAEIAGNPSEYPVFEANADNAALEYLTSRPNQWPPHTSRVGTFRTFRMSETLTTAMKDLSDPRLSVFGDPTAASEEEGNPEFVGVPNGLTDDASDDFNGGRSFQSSLSTTKYFEEPNAANGLIMTYAEVLFLKAEAAARGWTAEDTETLYEQGLTASMNQYGLEVPSGYLSQPGVAFESSQALQQIGQQKWIALFYTGLEGWFNWRRTGFPDIDPSVDNVNGDQIPVRFRYPDSEQALNAENYDEVTSESGQGPNNINTAMWLLE